MSRIVIVVSYFLKLILVIKAPLFITQIIGFYISRRIPAYVRNTFCPLRSFDYHQPAPLSESPLHRPLSPDDSGVRKLVDGSRDTKWERTPAVHGLDIPCVPILLLKPQGPESTNLNSGTSLSCLREERTRNRKN